MDKRQSQSDGNRRKARRCATVGCYYDDHQEKTGEHHFGDHPTSEYPPGKWSPLAVRSETSADGEASLTTGDAVRTPTASRNGANQLNNNVR